MSRMLLDDSAIHAGIKDAIGVAHQDTVEEVIKLAEDNTVLVIGMAHNPYCKKIRKALDGTGVAYRYVEYGSYTKEWRRRLALKMWTGWSTFPMVFVNGVLVGGNEQIEGLIRSGELKEMLK